jgi:hypothetical protein
MRLPSFLHMHAGALAIASRQPNSSSTVTIVTLPLATVILPPLLCHICCVTRRAAYVSTAATNDLYGAEHDISSIANISSVSQTTTSNGCSVTQQHQQKFTDNALSIVFRWLIRVCVQSSGTTASTMNTAALSKSINDTILHVVAISLEEDTPIAKDGHEDSALDRQVLKDIEHMIHGHTRA